ncbi:unnamed protein product [Rotaria sordida]|uniref:Protein kinase domain-containing protein n=1 Tax=Rotaria sordida TaxID=392033 RepID=A0A818JJE5_9BILA|nr:unnamed protein product [Rotaria sordida]CAF3545237.1 unnamed protein product [Rotaria sordida]
MSFRVETAPNQYTDYEIFSATRFNNIGRQFLSLVNPNYETTPNENKTVPNEKKSASNEKESTSNKKEPVPNKKEPVTNEKELATNEKEPATNEKEPAMNEKEPATNENETAPNENETTPNENKTTPNENETTPNESKTSPNENETSPNENETTPNESKTLTNENKVTTNENKVATNENKVTTNENKVTTNGNRVTTNEDKTPTNQNKPISRNTIQQPSDLCRPRQEQSLYYIVNQDVIKQIEENFIPYQSTLPYMAPASPPPTTTTNNIDTDSQLTTSIPDWQATKQSTESTRYLLSQIITIVQCRSTLSISSSSSLSQRTSRHAVRLFINSQRQQQQQMDTFLDIVNEALLLEPNTIKTLWDAKGEQITDPMDLLRRGRLYFASRDTNITLGELHISESDLASINRLEIIRKQLSQPAYFVEKPVNTEQIHIPSRKSTPFDGDEHRSATMQAQAMIYNDPQTFPEVFLRHYTVGEVLGDGRFSAVFECRDKATGIQLALKIIDKTRCKGYEYLIENELSILRRVKHPNIIKLVEEFQNELKYFLVLEYVSNGDLLTAVTTMNKYSEHDVALMLSQIASALKYLHSLQIVHRDVKLENVLMANYPDQSVTLKLADFGLALCLTDQTPIVAAHGDKLCGTPMYLAPEVIQNRDYRIENDMWSLGIIAFTLLSGMAPFNGDNDGDIISNVINKPIDFNLLPKISMDCREALMSMLERDPTKRISASELLQHPWIKSEIQRQMEPLNEGLTARRKKGAAQKQPMLTFSSVEHPHSMQGSNVGGLLGDMDEY